MNKTISNLEMNRGAAETGGGYAAQPWFQAALKDQSLRFLLLILVVALIGLLITSASAVFLSGLVGLVFLVLLVRKPELALAIQFNGTFIYFYSVYKLGLETSRAVTATFYGLLVCSYLLGGIVLIAGASRRFRIRLIDGIFTGLFSLFFFSYFLFSLSNGFAYRKATYAPFLVIAPYWGIRLLATEERIRKFFSCCVGVAAILILPSFYELLFNPVFAEYGRFSMYVFADKSDNPILFGTTFAVLLIILFFWISARGKISGRHLVLMLPSIFLLVRSGARGPVVSFLVTMLFYLLSVGGLKAKIKVYVAAFIAFLVVGSFSFIPDPTVSFYENAFTPEAQESRSIRERMILMELALREFRDHPVLGVGMGNSSGGIGYPHNVLLEVAAEFGLLGLSVFLLLCYFTVRQAVRSIKGNRDGNLLMRVALSLFIFSFVESMFSSNMGGNTLLFVSIGLVVAVAEMRKTEEPPATSGAGGLPS